ALGQGPHQRQRQKIVYRARRRPDEQQQAQRHADRDQGANQPLAQLDQVRDEAFRVAHPVLVSAVLASAVLVSAGGWGAGALGAGISEAGAGGVASFTTSSTVLLRSASVLFS